MISLTDKIANLSLVWKTASEIFYGVNKLNFNLDKKYNSYLSKIIKTKTDKQYYLLLAEFVNLLNDGHTVINFCSNFVKKVGHLPFRLLYINGSYYICDATDNLKNCVLQKIVSINGQSFNSLKNICFKYIHHMDNFCYHNRLEKILPLFLNKSNNKMVLQDGKTYSFNLLKQPVKLKTNINLVPKTPFKTIPTKQVFMCRFYNDIVYVRLNTFNNSAIVNECCETLKKLKNMCHVILDIRDNEGGMTALAEKVANLFIPGRYSACVKQTRKNVGIKLASASQYKQSAEKLEQWIADGITTKEIAQQNLNILNGGEFETYTDSFGKTKRKHINCKQYILTGRYTMSAAEDFVAMFKTNKRAVIVGEKTYGSTGTPYVINLTDGTKVRVCSVYYKLLDGTEFINKGIMPDICLKNTIKHYKNNTDFALDKVIELIQLKF